jgi:hypothetical protein
VAVRLLLIAWSRQNLAPHRWLAVLLISQTFSNLSLVGAEACVLWVDSILPAFSGLLPMKRSCQISARCEHTAAAGMSSVLLPSKIADKFQSLRAPKFILSSSYSFPS